MLRVAMTKVKSRLGSYVILHAKSNLPQDYTEQIQAYLDAGKDPECEFYDPTFPWDSAGVGLLYFGLKEEKDEWTAQLPDGRIIRAWNINPGCLNQMATAFDDYSRTMDAGRRVLLAGGTAEDAAEKMREFCRDHQFMPALESSPHMVADLLDEMEEFREILEDDACCLDFDAGTSAAGALDQEDAE